MLSRSGSTHRSYWDNGPPFLTHNCSDVGPRTGLHGRVLGVGVQPQARPLGLRWGPADQPTAMYVRGRRPPSPPDPSNDVPPLTRDPEAAYPFIPHWGPQEFFTIQ